MSRLEEIKQQYAESEQCDSIEELFGYLIFEKGGLHRVINIIAEKYAKECVKASLEKASENGLVSKNYDGKKFIEKKFISNMSNTFYSIDKESITNPENIILL